MILSPWVPIHSAREGLWVWFQGNPGKLGVGASILLWPLVHAAGKGLWVWILGNLGRLGVSVYSNRHETIQFTPPTPDPKQLAPKRERTEKKAKKKEEKKAKKNAKEKAKKKKENRKTRSFET